VKQRALLLFPSLALLLVSTLAAAEYRAPAGTEPPARRPGGTSVLPGGRIINPLGLQHTTGPGPFGLAVNPAGNLIVSADGGPNSYSLTVLQHDKSRWSSLRLQAPRKGEPAADTDDWRSVFMGLAFADDKTLYASEGNSGRVRVLHMPAGRKDRVYDLNQDGYKDSYSGDLALDVKRNLLYVLDQANFRLVVIHTKQHRILASLRVGRLPFALALSPDHHRLYITNIGMFEYQPVPGADPKQARETGLSFPAFGFPSAESLLGVKRETARGVVEVPGLGDPNARESNSLCAVDVSKPESPAIIRFVRTGQPTGPRSVGGSSPSGVAASEERIYVANGHNDSISVIHAATLELEKEIEIRIPGLEQLRGVLPIGLTLAAGNRTLLVAEAGINAIGVIDTATNTVLGHLPAAWFPTRVAVHHNSVYVSNAKGQGTGPNADSEKALPDSFQANFRRGAVTAFDLPPAAALPDHTRTVLRLNGFLERSEEVAAVPAPLRYAVVIVKENRTYDEVFGDLETAANGPLYGAPSLARYGRRGWAAPDANRLLGSRESLRSVNATPNHQELAQRFAFSDNFYADSEVSVDGHHWLVGSYPNAWTESSLMAGYGGQKDFRLSDSAPGRLSFAQSNASVHPEELLQNGTIWHHLERHGIPFRNFGEGFELAGVDESAGLMPTGARYLTNVPMPDPLYRNTSRRYPQFNMNIPDQYRADAFIREIDEMYAKPGKDLPRFLYIHLPNDHTAKSRPEDGYPFPASYVADNDIALGRIVEYLSHTQWWKQMAVFITEDDAQGGVDHVDSHRTVLLVAGPYAKKNYNHRMNSSFPGLLKTVFRVLGIPPLNLFDAAATDLSDCFTVQPDFMPYKALPVNPALFDPTKAKDPIDPLPSPRMDDPRVLEEQHKTYIK
jgi:YVTN family beta-propeller protein